MRLGVHKNWVDWTLQRGRVHDKLNDLKEHPPLTLIRILIQRVGGMPPPCLPAIGADLLLWFPLSPACASCFSSKRLLELVSFFFLALQAVCTTSYMCNM